MNRRGFLKLLGMAATAAVLPDLELDPERALWVPGAKRIFDLGGSGLDDPAGLADVFDELRTGRNQFLTIDMITRETLRVLEDQLSFIKRVNRDYDAKFPGVGYRVNVRRPDRFGPDGRPVVVLRPGEEFITIERT